MRMFEKDHNHSTERLLTSSNAYGAYILGCLFIGSLGIFALIYTLLKWQSNTSITWSKAAARAKREAWKQLKLPLPHHSYGGYST